ncbi:MAG: hypothetical protein KC561_19345, partial [Myxococcales bacterium]|nr:hypothetical protein [Myxococcales bacterium]
VYVRPGGTTQITVLLVPEPECTSVGTEGGTLTSQNGAELSIPAGALASSTSICFGDLPNQAAPWRGPASDHSYALWLPLAFDFDGSSLEFSTPAELRVPVDPGFYRVATLLGETAMRGYEIEGDVWRLGPFGELADDGEGPEIVVPLDRLSDNLVFQLGTTLGTANNAYRLVVQGCGANSQMVVDTSMPACLETAFLPGNRDFRTSGGDYFAMFERSTSQGRQGRRANSCLADPCPGDNCTGNCAAIAEFSECGSNYSARIEKRTNGQWQTTGESWSVFVPRSLICNRLFDACAAQDVCPSDTDFDCVSSCPTFY